jgi:hypothetical protein
MDDRPAHDIGVPHDVIQTAARDGTADLYDGAVIPDRHAQQDSEKYRSE